MDNLDRLALAAAREVVQADVADSRDEEHSAITRQAAWQVLAMFDQHTTHHSES